MTLSQKSICPYDVILTFKDQLQRFHKLSFFDRFRQVENGFDLNF